MNDHTSREGEDRAAEKLLDQVLASNHAELLDTMADALDTAAGLEALKPLRASEPRSVPGTAPGPSACAPSARSVPSGHFGDHSVTAQPAVPQLSARTALVLLAALSIGLVVGTLSVLAGAPVASSVLAGLTGGGASIPVLNMIIQ